MRVLETHLLRGPNVYTHNPCLMAVLEVEDQPARLAELEARLQAAVPALGQLALAGGDGLPGLVARLIEALQQEVGSKVGFCFTRPVKNHTGRHEVVAGFEYERLAQDALKLAMAWVQDLLAGRAPELDAGLARLQRTMNRVAVGPSTRAVVDAALRRGIPIFRLTEDASLFQLGWGKHARRIQATTTGNTSDIAVDLAQDKDLTKALLAEAGLPVPSGMVARGPEEAVVAARELGGPVALKPLDGNQGKGVSLNLTDPEEIRVAYALAASFRRSVLVERYVAGDDYRVLVVGKKVVAASRRFPAHVVGDGHSTITQLVAVENRNPDRGEGHSKAMTWITLDEASDQVLARQGLTSDSVPLDGQQVLLKENANLSTGGSAEDVTHLIHPANARICVRAARQIGLDVAGIDLVCRDLAVPLEEQGGAIIEVNAAPGIRMHQHPAKGEPHDVGAAIVDALFPLDAPSRIPVLAVTGTNGKTTTALLMAHILQSAGVVTGATSTEAVYIDGHVAKTGDCTGYWSARMVLTCPDVEAAILETARGGMFKRGLAFDMSDVGVVLNVHDDHLGQHGAETLEDLAKVKALIVRTARRGVVLNAEDALVAAMAPARPAGCELAYFSLDPVNPVLQQHLAAGGRGVYWRNGMIMLAQGKHHIPLVEVERLPFTLGGKARFNVANALAATAALLLAGYSVDLIVAGLKTFTSSPDQNPGRMNFFRVRNFQVLADYAHNPASYEALTATARQLPHKRLIGVLAAPGDRYDDKLREIGRICAGTFELLLVREMAGDLRGRPPGETPRLIAEGAAAGGLASGQVKVVLDEQEAVEEALALARDGDLVVIGCADTPRLLAQLAGHAEGQDGRAASQVSLTLSKDQAPGRAPESLRV